MLSYLYLFINWAYFIRCSFVVKIIRLTAKCCLKYCLTSENCLTCKRLLPIGLPTQRCINMHTGTMLNQVVLSTLKQCWYFQVAFVCKILDLFRSVPYCRNLSTDRNRSSKILARGDVTVDTTLFQLSSTV